MKEFLLVFCGAGIGGAVRFSAIRLMAQFMTANYYAIFLCNMMGCFFAGIILSYALTKPHLGWINLFFITGLAGGLTTFSAFSLDSLNMIQSGQTITALSYIMFSICLGIIFCGAGVFLGKVLF